MRRLAFIAALVHAAAASAFPLVDGGRAAPVYVPGDAEATTLLAADEWTNYVFRATGAAAAVRRPSCGLSSRERRLPASKRCFSSRPCGAA